MPKPPDKAPRIAPKALPKKAPRIAPKALPKKAPKKSPKRLPSACIACGGTRKNSMGGDCIPCVRNKR